jgi:glycosyltransferase involved in cell wall biosynthesis
VKIIYLHQYFNTPSMSGGTRSYEMGRRLVAAGHEVHMVTSARDDGRGGGWRQTNEAGIIVHWLPVPYSNKMSYLSRIFAFLRFAVRAARKSASLGGDVVFATSTPLTIALPAVYAAERNRIPMVFEVRDLWPELPIAIGALKNPVLKYLAVCLERFSYKNSTQIVALSPGMKDGIVRTGYPEEKVHVIPNSADLELFSPDVAADLAVLARLPNLEEKKLVVYAGTFGTINGISYFVRMACASKSKGYPLHFLALGDGAERNKVECLAKELGVDGDYVTFMDPIPKSKVPAVLAAADVACSLFIDLEPMWANSANKFFDGLASGTLMAINYGGWQADLLKQYGAGLVLPPHDPARAACLLAEFVKDGDRLNSAALAARKLAESRFSRDRLAAQLEKVLLESCGEKIP